MGYGDERHVRGNRPQTHGWASPAPSPPSRPESRLDTTQTWDFDPDTLTSLGAGTAEPAKLPQDPFGERAPAGARPTRPDGPARSTARTATIVCVSLAACSALLFGLATGMGIRDAGRPDPVEIHLLAIGDAIAYPDVLAALPNALPEGVTSATQLPTAPPADLPTPGEATGTAVTHRTVHANEARLYATRAGATFCQPEALLASLDAAQESGLAQALGHDTAALPDVLATMTPLVTLDDIRARDLGPTLGATTPREVVLQRGTSVLVDRRGAPRVRCGSATALGEPSVGPGTPVRPVGPSWGTSLPAAIVVSPVDHDMQGFLAADLDDPTASIDKPVGPAPDGDRRPDAPRAMPALAEPQG